MVLETVLLVSIIPNQLMMKGLSRRVVDYYNSYGEKIRLVAGIIHHIGFKHSVIQVVNQRGMPESLTTISLKNDLMLDSCLTLSINPLNYIIYFGVY